MYNTLKDRLSNNINVIVITFLCLACVAVALFHLTTLTSFPPIFIDESWYANVAWNWLTTGKNIDTLHAGTPVQLHFPFIGNLPYVLSFSVAGLGFFQARIVSWVFGIFLLFLIFFATKQSYSPIAGALAALFLALSPPFTQASHYARPDIFLAVVIVLVFIIVRYAFETERRWAHFTAGLIIALAFDIHPNAILFAAGFATLYLYIYRKGLLRQTGTWLFVAGGVVGVAYYIVVSVLPAMSDAINYYRFSVVNSHPMPLMSFNPMELIKSARDEIGRYHFFDNRLDFVLIGASIVYFAVRRKKADVIFLVFVGVVFACFVLVIGNKHDIYAILLYPFFMIMVAESIVSIIRNIKEMFTVYAFVISLVALVLFSNTYHLARSFQDSRGYKYEAITNKIKSVVPKDALIVGLPNWWLGLNAYDYKSILDLSFYNLFDDYSLTEGLYSMHPNIIIVDSGLQGLLVDHGYFKAGSGFELYKMPRNEFEDFLSERGTKILDFNDNWHGRFEIYSINWDK